ncbi:MAG: RsmF rRNA methyltransferase first C-terminal domain-containing protein [Eubacteriales bacterium]
MKEPWEHEILQVKEQFLLLPNRLPQLDGLGVLRAGVPLGEGKTNRIEPAHGLFMAAKPEELYQALYFADDRGAQNNF